MTKFEEIIDNPKIFKIILDEFFRDWPGSYDVMPVENPHSRLFKSDADFTSFCHAVRSKELGMMRCLQCDVEHANKAAKKGEPLYYTCHAGLMDIAVPIIVNGQLIATIFCGQSRWWDEKKEEEACQLTISAERELGFEIGELFALREITSQITARQVEDVENKLWEVAKYVSVLGSRKIEAERSKHELALRLRESIAIQDILHGFSEIVDDLGQFWGKLDEALEKIRLTIEADHGILLVCEQALEKGKSRGIIQSIANLPPSFKSRIYPVCDGNIREVIIDMQAKIVDMPSKPEHGSLYADILNLFAGNDPLDKIALVPLQLEPQYPAVMMFFLSNFHDVSQSRDIQQELGLLVQAGVQIVTAYQNCLLNKDRKWYAEVQGQWLENVSHQLLAPLNGIIGQGQNLLLHFYHWQEVDPARIDRTLETLIELSNWTSRLAKNFAWIARGDDYIKMLNLQVENDLPGKLISYARNVQGMAKARGVFRVHVDRERIGLLNGIVQIDRDFFKQAVTNLLDNAVKYANPRTEVLIRSSFAGNYGRIHITNYGIQVKESEVEKIFERGYRSEAAKNKYAVGTGIGLTIARKIIRLHNGNLKVDPSTETPQGWKTIFTISLPLLRERSRNE